MDLRHLAADATLMVIVCVAAMFLHPVAHGPYSAVHGPTSALRAYHRSRVVLTAIALAAFSAAAQLTSGMTLLAFFALGGTALIIFSNRGPEPCPLRC
jgi:hypothetical protein